MTARRKLIVAYALVGVGVIMLLGAAWIIYWPIAVALAGVGIAGVGGVLIQIPETRPAPQPPTRLRR